MEQRHVRTRYLPTGEPELITRVRDEGTKVTRWMQYDSHGRMVVNVEPNTTANYVNWSENSTLRTTIGATKPWRYAYNALGELLGTSDARGCGQNFYYDHVGRLIAEDYSPCEEHHTDYTEIPPTADLSTPDDASGAEVYYLYDQQVASDAMPDNCGSNYLKGRTVAVFDRASVTKSVYDPRGRVTQSCLRVAKPESTNDDIPIRYASRTYKKSITYDIADREVAATTGLESGPLSAHALAGSDTQSRITTQYTARGTVKSVGGSYGPLIDNIQRTADGLMQQMRYGDAADTTTAYSYDQRRRLSSVQTYRGPPASGIWDAPGSYSPDPYNEDEPTLQLLLQDESFTYDIVGNPVEIHDWRDPSEWPAGAKPVSKKIQYDDLYRATRVDYQYTTGDDEWQSPFAYENEGYGDPRRADPAPHQDFDKRILQQTFRYDWLGNNDHTDDDAHGFYDRSLGTITNGTEQPYQLQAAAQSSGTHSGNLSAEYDPAGNLTRLSVNRDSTACLPQGADCDQVYEYEWDEVGRLVSARRFDAGGQELAADLGYHYDASDQRVIKRASFAGGEGGQQDRYTLYLFDTLELRRAEFGLSSGPDYEYTEDTVVPYLLANGVRLARVMWEFNSLPAVDAGQAHVFFELGDHLGSTSVVLDQATGELVERATFQAYGGAESDYRPERWAGFREDYRFTGKEEDVEVGLQYFGKRFLNPLLGRWVSADPLAVHVPGEADWNLYAYVSGALLKNVDPLGLTEDYEPPLQNAKTGPAEGERNTGHEPTTIPEVTVEGTVPPSPPPPKAQPKPAAVDEVSEARAAEYGAKVGVIQAKYDQARMNSPSNSAEYAELEKAEVAKARAECGKSCARHAGLHVGTSMTVFLAIAVAAGYVQSKANGGRGSGGAGRGGRLDNRGAHVDTPETRSAARVPPRQSQVAPLGRGSTANGIDRWLPRNLREHLAVQEAMQNAAAGQRAAGPLGDSRWPASAGWVKMQQTIDPGGREGPISVHYNFNTNTREVDDFKIVYRRPYIPPNDPTVPPGGP